MNDDNQYYTTHSYRGSPNNAAANSEYNYPTNATANSEYNYPTNATANPEYNYPTNATANPEYNYPTNATANPEYNYPTDATANPEYNYTPEVIAYPKKKASQRKRYTTPILIYILFAAVLMLGSGAFGAVLATQHMRASIADLEQQQANTYAMLGDIEREAQSDTSPNETNPSGETSSSGVTNPSGETNPSSETGLEYGTMTVPELFQVANPAVVAISTQMQGRNAFGMAVVQPSAGSGFLVSEDGYIVTNHHVIENAISISVLLHDGTSHPAELVGGDPHSDLAVLKVDLNDMAFLGFADSDILLVGEPVVAIGNPLGEFANSMSVGVVSALDREINIDGIPRSMLQTDAAVNSGNSGGPLIDMTGHVVGVVTAKSGGMNVEGLGFAIPSNVVQRVSEEIINTGSVRGRAVMGVQIGETVHDGQPRIFIDSVLTGAGAHRAGIQPGDIILSVNDNPISRFEELRRILDNLYPGDTITMQVLRNGTTMDFTITLDEAQA